MNNFEISPKNGIPATLLSLKLKEKISFDEYNEQIIIENDNVDDLSGNEILVFYSIINEKLEGLKNYLKDYSSIDEMDENGLALWEDYLIYSVIFNQNDTVVKNISDKYISI